MNSLIRAAVLRPVSTLMAFGAIVLIGLIALGSLGVAELPEISIPRLVISTSYPGLPADEVRLLVSQPLEDALMGLRGLKHIESVSRPGVSSISLQFNWGADLRSAGVEARELLDAIQGSLPDGVAKPQVLPVDPTDEALIVVGVYPRNGDLTLARRLASREIRTRFQQLHGVGSVVVVGGRDEEIHVDVDRQLLAGRNLDLEGLGRIIASSNGDYPAGTLTEGDKEFVVKAHGSVANAVELSQIYVAAGVASFRLGDIASVELGQAEQISAFSSGGRPGVALYLHRQPGVSPLEAAGSIRAELLRLNQTWGRDVDCELINDASILMSRSVSSLAFDGLAGMLIAFVVLLFFVRDLPVSLVIMSSVPVAILMSLSFLWICGKSINLMSIGGLALGIGMMVDNSVVVLENIQKRLLPGVAADPQRVIEATAELSMSNIGATGTALIVFLPVLFMPGVVGAVFTDLALAVIGAQMASFIVSITLVPVLYLLLSGLRSIPVVPSKVIHRIERWFQTGFFIVLRRPIALWLTLGIVLSLGVLAFWGLPVRFMPAIDSGSVQLTVETPYGTSLARCIGIATDFEQRIARTPGVDHVYSRCGGEAADYYYAADPRDRPEIIHLMVVLGSGARPTAALIAETLRELLADSGLIVTASLPANPVSQILGLREGGMSIRVSGETIAEAEGRLTEVRGKLVAQFGANRVRVYPDGLRSELHFLPDRAELARSSGTLVAVAQALNAGMEGNPVSSIKRFGREVPVRLRMRAEDRGSVAAIGRFPLRGENNQLIQVSSLGHIEIRSAAGALYRSDRLDSHMLLVPTGAPEALASMDGVSLPDAELLQEQGFQFMLILILVLALLYLFLGAQLQSFLLPLVIMTAIPLSFSGIFMALFLGRSSINIDSLLGIIVLVGVVVNNSIILYENYSQRIHHMPGTDRIGVVIQGTRERIRPIVMTMSISVISLLPVAIDNSGTSTQNSMAMAVIGGLLVSTLLTVIVIPRLFLAYFKARSKTGAIHV